MCSIDSRPFILNRSSNNNFHWGQTLMKLLCTSVSYPGFMFSMAIYIYSMVISLFIIFPNLVYYHLIRKKVLSKRMSFDVYIIIYRILILLYIIYLLLMNYIYQNGLEEYLYFQYL